MLTKRILFVCMGNICRSPSAEAVMVKLAKDEGVFLEIDSAGTIAHHVGEPADARMQRHATKRGYQLTSISRQVCDDDFSCFDLLVAMDSDNFSELHRMAPSMANLSKVVMMTDYCRVFNNTSVPDPYYGGSRGFELVLDLLEDACAGLLERVR